MQVLLSNVWYIQKCSRGFNFVKIYGREVLQKQNSRKMAKLLCGLLKKANHASVTNFQLRKYMYVF